MAAKQESLPKPRKKQYRETLDLESASGWKKWNLDAFQVTFTHQEYTNLKDELGKNHIPSPDPQYDGGKFVNGMTDNRPR